MKSLPKSAATGIYWPALPNPTDSLLLALQYQLEQSQWWSSAELSQMQLRQLSVLLLYTSRTNSFYRERLQIIPDLGKRLLTMEDLRLLPILSRQELQQQGRNLLSDRIPPDHLPIDYHTTSGSIGRPVEVATTKVTDIFYRAFNLRYHLWHQRNFQAKTAVISIDACSTSQADKQKIWAEVFPSGEVVEFSSGKTVEQQLAFLIAEQPAYLLTYPSNLMALIEDSQKKGLELPFLKAANTFGELVTEELRQICRDVWHLPLIDAYSSKEAGIIAIQCPQNSCYHVQSENILLEILDENDYPCSPGQVGRVVVTSLHNYALPLIRYEIGDYAEVGAACKCGRSLPVINRILGRQRNMMTLPDGNKVWPNYIVSQWAKIASISQIQVVQSSLEKLKIKLVAEGRLTDREEERLELMIQRDFNNQFEYELIYLSEIPRSAGGKYEDFISEVF